MPILHKAGEAAREFMGTRHWWKNTGSQTRHADHRRHRQRPQADDDGTDDVRAEAPAATLKPPRFASFPQGRPRLQQASTSNKAGAARRRARLPGQVVLVLQGAALGAYQVGVYEALHDAGIEPRLGDRHLDRRDQRRADRRQPAAQRGAARRLLAPRRAAGHRRRAAGLAGDGQLGRQHDHGDARHPGSFGASPSAARPRPLVGAEAAALLQHRTAAAHAPGELVDFGRLPAARRAWTVGAVNACSGAMRYFDSRDEALCVEHVMASGALPPAFPAVRIGGEPYWDGGLYSNTPIEAVLDDRPRRDSLIFAVNVWHQTAPEFDRSGRCSGGWDIQYASRADGHLARQKQIHRLRHVIRELTRQLPTSRQADPAVQELAAWGCGTTMHVAHLLAPRLGRDHEDIDFTPAGVTARREAGMPTRAGWSSARRGRRRPIRSKAWSVSLVRFCAYRHRRPAP